MNSESIVTNPPVATLLKMASEEQHSKLQLLEYRSIIEVLMKKGFSGRAIINWLEEHGAGRYSASQLSKVVVDIKDGAGD